MGYLLDTHAIIWALYKPHLLSAMVRNALTQNAEEHYYSPASLWEITIKQSLGKLDLDVSLPELFAAVRQSGLRELPVEMNHLLALQNLPQIHRDPFDRLLISQTIAESLTFISKDEVMKNYSVRLLW